MWVDDANRDVIITKKGAGHYEALSGRPVSTGSVPKDLIPPEGLMGPIYVFRSSEKGQEVVRDGAGKV
jgi:hypothetical protein